MAGSTPRLTNQPLGFESSFNGVFLVEYITIGILTLWFLFYFNRVFSTVVSYAIRLYTWHSLGIYIDIESLQISLLAGRVFFKGVRYHGENETIQIHGGYITWQYWLGKVKESKLFQDQNGDSVSDTESSTPGKGKSNRSRSRSHSIELEEQGLKRRRKDLPCRISVKVSGVEAFCHNRSPAYDAVIESVVQHDSDGRNAESRQKPTERSEKSAHECLVRPTTDNPSSSAPSSRFRTSEPTTAPRQEPTTEATGPAIAPEPPLILRLLPIHVQVNKAAMVLGNENTPSIITAKIDSATGEFDAGKAGPLDIFKILMGFEIVRPVVQMKPNVDYKRPQLAEGAMLKQATGHPGSLERPASDQSTKEKSSSKVTSKWRKLRSLPGLSLAARKSLESVVNLSRPSSSKGQLPDAHAEVSGQHRWLGLTRYLEDDQQDESDEWNDVEYAKASTLADINSVYFKFYWDIAGQSPIRGVTDQSSMPNTAAQINGSDPPEYGMELNVRGGRVFYGPWADRHRLILQQLFFPAPFADARATFFIKPGDTRLCTIFNLVLSVDAETILRVPFREPSKDWRYKDRAGKITGKGRRPNDSRATHHHSRKKSSKRRASEKPIHTTDARPYAWFDIVVQAGSTISYVMDMFPSTGGYKNELSVDVAGIEIYSSLNHALLWRSQNVILACQIPYPLAWNGLREWVFDITIKRLDFFLLRDHTFLLMDLIEDWSRGPLPAFFTFVPYRYILKTKFEDFKLFLNVNDANLVNNSDDLEDNDFVILYGGRLDADLVIPIDSYRPSQNEITFDVAAYDLGFELAMPPKNTLSALLENKDVAQLQSVILKGTYGLCDDVRPGLTETLNMKIAGKGLTIVFYGYFARHLVKIKENYFGDDVHFRTYEEFQQLLAEDSWEPSNTIPTSTKSNDLDVILDISAEDGRILLPCGLYDCDEYVELILDSADVDLRVNNYYLELMVDSRPLRIGYKAQPYGSDNVDVRPSGHQIAIDSVNVSGHRLFGLPPVEPAYVSNWDIDVGDIVGEMSCEFLGRLVAAAQAVALTITDEENGLPLPQLAPVHDTTFVRFQSSLIRLWLRAADVAFLFNTDNVHGTFNDFASKRFSQDLILTVPDLYLACVDAEGVAENQRQHPHVVETHAYLQTALSLRMVQRSLHVNQDRNLQQDHIAKHDQRSQRAQFLLATTNEQSGNTIPLCLPVLPVPLRSNAPLHTPRRAHKVDQAQPSMHSQRAIVFDATGVAHRRHKSDQAHKPHTMSESVFKSPHLSLDLLPFDTEDLPEMPRNSTQPKTSVQSADTSSFNGSLDENAVHTSLVISTDPGIVAMCKPKTVQAISEITQAIGPKAPVAVFDDYQVQTVSEVIALLTRKRGKRSVVDMSIKVPCLHIRCINPDMEPAKTQGSSSGDEFNVTSGAITTLVRIKNMPDRKHAEDMKAVHITVASIAATARRRSSSHNNAAAAAAALHCKLDDVLIWLADSDRMIIHASQKMLEVFIASKDLQYLATLVHRTTITIDRLQAPFIALAAKRGRRRRFLIHRLAQLGEDIADPAFLTRPSYMIRSAKDHLRNSDSWKIVTRLRWVLKSVDKQIRKELLTALVGETMDVPADYEAYVLSSLDQWRSWDAIHVKDSIAMRILFPSRAGVEKLHDRSAVPLSVVGQATGLRIVIDTGGKRNEIDIAGMALALNITPPPPRSAMRIFQEYHEVRTVLVQVATTHFGVRLKWEIVDLVDQITTLFERDAPGQVMVNSASRNTPTLSPDALAREEVHMVLSTESADIELETIHLSQSLASKEFKVSVTGSGWSGGYEDFSVNVLVAAGAASMAMHAGDRLLWHSSVTEPSLCVAYVTARATESNREALYISADGNKGLFYVDEDILGMIESVNLVLKDEVNHIQMLSRKHSELRTVDCREARPVPHREPITVYVALFMKEYIIWVALLPDLRFVAEGRIVRTSIVPDPAGGTSYKADFDLKGQTYKTVYGNVDDPKAVSTLDLPPINGTVRMLIVSSLITASANFTIEHVHLQGAELYGMLSLLATPAVASAIDAIKEDALALQNTFKRISPSPATNRRSSLDSKSRSIVFDAGFVLAGITISAHVPTASREHGKAKLMFQLGSTQLRAANRSSKGDMPLPFPELSFTMGKMELMLQESHGEGSGKCGNVYFASRFRCAVDEISDKKFRREFMLSAVGPVVDLYTGTAPMLVSIIAHFQDRLKGLDLSRERKYLRRLRNHQVDQSQTSHTTPLDTATKGKLDVGGVSFVSTFSFNLQGTSITYIPVSDLKNSADDLVFTLKEINLLTRSEEKATLKIDEMRLDLLSPSQERGPRSRNSAMLPEVIFNVAHEVDQTGRRLTFHAAGEALDLQIEPDVVGPINSLESSISESSRRTRAAMASLQAIPVPDGTSAQTSKRTILGDRPLASLLVTANFAGAVIRLQGGKGHDPRRSLVPSLQVPRAERQGRYGHFETDKATTGAALRAPGLALKVKYVHERSSDPSLNAEIRIEGSSNSLTPAVVPLIAQMVDNVKSSMRKVEAEHVASTPKAPSDSTTGQRTTDQAEIVRVGPSAILGRTRLSVGFRICKQEFTMTCQPIAKVAANARLDDVYVTINTIESTEDGNFFALAAKFTNLQASLQHVYSREATFVFDIESIILSMMNSRHISGTPGISAMLKINPMKAQLNAKQMQDLLLFREIWLPPEIRSSPSKQDPTSTDEPQEYFVRRYHQIAASTAFPWNATLALAGIHVEMDLGQAIGKLSADVKDLWASSKKTTSSQQTLCVGIDNVSVDGTGRMSGFMQLHRLKGRTSIAWTASDTEGSQTPLVQGSIGFQELRLKAAFDYQAFAIAHITSFEFIVYNVRDQQQRSGDRLVAILDGDKINVYCVAISAALAVSLVQAFERLVQEKKASYEQSLRDVEALLHRKSSILPDQTLSIASTALQSSQSKAGSKMPLRLHTDVVVTLGSLDVGAFPRTMADTQLLKLEAVEVQARFAVVPEGSKIHSGLGLTLGQVCAALADVPRQVVPKTLGEISIEEVVKNATSARGGVILRVPRVKATMQTWQAADNKAIDYKFRSTFEGKIDVGWNYSRISFIRGVWETHCRTLASRLGKPLPQSALKITGPQSAPEQRQRGKDEDTATDEQGKITAVVNLPQSKYTYCALEPPVIDTPQLRDMGEATPPLEWIGLNRDKLPNVTHQVVIVTLLEVVKEVEDAYTRVLGSA